MIVFILGVGKSGTTVTTGRLMELGIDPLHRRPPFESHAIGKANKHIRAGRIDKAGWIEMASEYLDYPEPWCCKHTLWYLTLPWAMELFKGRDVRLCLVSRPREANIASLQQGFYPEGKAARIYDERNMAYSELKWRYDIPELYLAEKWRKDDITKWLQENVINDRN